MHIEEIKNSLFDLGDIENIKLQRQNVRYHGKELLMYVFPTIPEIVKKGVKSILKNKDEELHEIHEIQQPKSDKFKISSKKKNIEEMYAEEEQEERKGSGFFSQFFGKGFLGTGYLANIPINEQNFFDVINFQDEYMVQDNTNMEECFNGLGFDRNLTMIQHIYQAFPEKQEFFNPFIMRLRRFYKILSFIAL